MHVGDYQGVDSHMRRFIRQRPLENVPIRLFQATFASGFSAINIFSNSHMQKFLLRQVRAADNAVREGGDAGARSSPSKEARLQEAGDEEEQSGDDEEGGDDSPGVSATARFRPTKPNPIFHALYGQMLLASKSYLSALGEHCVSCLILSFFLLTRKRERSLPGESVRALSRRSGAMPFSGDGLPTASHAKTDR
jgi:general transcription factor 3C polypeptide 3 (transcription factor C subunit 4)